MNWIYNENNIIELSDMPIGTIGFIYKISNKKTGQYYIGKKNVASVRKKKFGKKQIALITDKRLKHYENFHIYQYKKFSLYRFYHDLNNILVKKKENLVDLLIL